MQQWRQWNARQTLIGVRIGGFVRLDDTVYFEVEVCNGLLKQQFRRKRMELFIFVMID
jgi:hypothetical protein